MRLRALLAMCSLAVSLAGCQRQPGRDKEVASRQAALKPAKPPSAPTEPPDHLSPFDPQQFVLAGYEFRVTAAADLDGDGVEEHIVVSQSAITDELGEPQDPAYFTLAWFDGEKWAEWLSIPAPGDERYVDDESMVAAEDLNDDGVVELALEFYGFGVSSRPETLYVWQVLDEGLEPAIEGEAVETSSDDGLMIEDLDLNYPGRELIFAIMQGGDEAHAAPHRYEIVVYGWAEGMYGPVDRLSPDVQFGGPDAALEAYAGGYDY